MLRWIPTFLYPVFFFLSFSMAAETGSLPIEKVVLYKNGLGYFQHLGEVEGSQTVDISLSSSQLNDVLKSLTVLDLGGGEVTSVGYDSAAPFERQLEGLPIDPKAAASLVGFLNQLRGSLVRLGGGQTVQGHLVSAELRSRGESGGGSSQTVEIGVLTDDGSLRVVDLQSAGGVSFVDATLASELKRFMQILNTRNQSDIRVLRIRTAGAGRRQLFVAYTAEAPIWKTTYRVVADPGKKTLLQGWAIVDNTTTQDWKDVELSLVSGAPVSFIQELSQPLYASRPFVPLPEGVQVQPQIHEQTFEGAADEEPKLQDQSMREDARARMEMRAAAPRAAVGGVLGAVPPPPPAPGEAIRQSVTETARGISRADLFEYRFPHRLTLETNRSALVPILQTEVDASKVSVYNTSYGSPNPRLAIWLKNTSSLTLDGGAFTVIDSNTFAGEGLLETLQPGEQRLLSYAVDLSTQINSQRESEQERVERVTVNRGLLQFHRKLLETQTYLIRNNSETERKVVVEHPIRPGWELRGNSGPEEVSNNYYRFQTSVAAGSNGRIEIQEERPLETTFQLTNVTPDQIGIWIRQKDIPSQLQSELQKIVEAKSEVARLQGEVDRFEKEEAQIFRDQERIRDNLGRLSRTPEEAQLRQRYLNSLEEEENRLQTLRSALAATRERLESAQQALNNLIQNLSFDGST